MLSSHLSSPLKNISYALFTFSKTNFRNANGTSFMLILGALYFDSNLALSYSLVQEKIQQCQIPHKLIGLWKRVQKYSN